MAVSGQFARTYTSCWSQTATCKKRLQGGVPIALAQKPAAISQLAKIANSQILRALLHAKARVFSRLQMVGGLLP